MAAGVFVGQDNISLIRELAAPSDPEDPGCGWTHAAPAAGRADTLSQPVNVCWGLQSQQVGASSWLDEQRATRKEDN